MIKETAGGVRGGLNQGKPKISLPLFRTPLQSSPSAGGALVSQGRGTNGREGPEFATPQTLDAPRATS